MNDILNNLFGGGGFGGFRGFGGFGGFGGDTGSGPAQKVYRGRDIRVRVKMTLEEISRGAEKEITLEKNIPCSECGGKGAKNSSDIKTCPACNGTGQVKRVVNSIFGQTISYSTCQQCGGEGKVISNPCRHCNGTGLERKRETVKVSIPAGVEDGLKLTVRGGGHSAKNNGVNGDLLVLIEEVAHPEFRRSGTDLFYTKIISVTDAILGTEVEIPCIDGKYKIKVDPGTQSETVVRLKGRGLPRLNSSSTGDLYVKFIVWIPKKLGRDEKSMMETLRSSDSFKPNPSKDDKKIFDKLKDIF